MRKTKAGVSVEGCLPRSVTGRLPGALRGCVALEGRLRPVAKYVGWVLCTHQCCFSRVKMVGAQHPPYMNGNSATGQLRPLPRRRGAY